MDPIPSLTDQVLAVVQEFLRDSVTMLDDQLPHHALFLVVAQDLQGPLLGSLILDQGQDPLCLIVHRPQYAVLLSEIPEILGVLPVDLDLEAMVAVLLRVQHPLVPLDVQDRWAITAHLDLAIKKFVADALLVAETVITV